MSKGGRTQAARIVLVALSAVGAIAVLALVGSIVLSGDLKSVLRMIALIAAAGAAILGITFAFVGGRRR
ncbi:MAG: hypothetical protein ACTHXA_09680 [Gulosibacter sp.]|uniref:hypothetical protein n=1 Tax=Gulosibacter sp. TaxID=2817531 RepID=UPI003F8F9D9B